MTAQDKYLHNKLFSRYYFIYFHIEIEFGNRLKHKIVAVPTTRVNNKDRKEKM